jgi:hypothetical protein
MMTQLELKFPCPSCGHLVHAEPPGSSRICSICFWEDDVCQLRWPGDLSGANKVSLIEAQRNYEEFAAIEVRFRGMVRPPAPDEPLDEGWRRIDLEVDAFEDIDAQMLPWPEDRTVLYWWRESFWRAAR